MTRPARPAGYGAADTFTLAAVSGVAVLAFGHWLIGNVASLLRHGQPLHASPAQAFAALLQLPDHGGDPRRAWPPTVADQLPGAVLYWTSALLVLLALTLLLSAGASATQRVRGSTGGGRGEPIDRRRRLGVPTQARLATTRDLAPLRARTPEPGRFLIAPHGRRHLLLTEAPNYKGRRGVRGAVAIFGPSQSGKTTGLIRSVHAWTGPAVICSVKTDLLHATLPTRSQAGDVRVFDPLGVSGHPCATWSPLRAATSLPGALAAAQALARTGEHGPQDAFWRGQAEQLLAGMLWTAASTPSCAMSDVVDWVLDLDRPSDAGTGTLAPLIRLLTDHDDADTARTARQVQGWLHGQWNTDPRTTSSVYATARNAVWPWADPQIAASATDNQLDLDWLISGENTLYLVAPLGDDTRLGLVFAALLHDLVNQAFEAHNRTGRAADPAVLLLIDEAANTPLPKLPQWAATVTGAGLQLVTVWQSKAQLDQLYGPQADNVLTNHRSKLFYPSGLSDPATSDYLHALAGTEHVRGDLSYKAWESQATRRHASSPPAAAVPLLPASVLRQLEVGDALLIHGQLPPAWLDGVGRHRR